VLRERKAWGESEEAELGKGVPDQKARCPRGTKLKRRGVRKEKKETGGEERGTEPV